MDVRAALGELIFARVAGEEGSGRRDRIHGTPGPRRFSSDSAIWRVHGDASMFVGGIRALLLQSLHPLAMAAVDQHSGFRGDPWGRLNRTSAFLAETTFATTADADRAIDVVRSVHAHIDGVAPDGRAYRADDPDLLRWVHVAEVDSFLRAHDRYGRSPLPPQGRDDYVAQTAVIGRALGACDVPTCVAELDEAIEAFRPELASTAAARRTTRYLLVHPPVPWTLRGPYSTLAAAAVGLLPRWSRWPLRVPWLPVTEATLVRGAATATTRTIRWAMAPSSVGSPPR
ncbi:oxygenase MpaB family protein [Aeromicrobium sp. CTD01-1L150]|uniref:oxygenase MpaB family protein n=1 Tax=Aeromicrobium sp. CTD01-1L150 TaxID=3341830 RepID=UPI0035BF5513